MKAQTHKEVCVLFDCLTFTEIKKKLGMSASVGAKGQVIQVADSVTQNLICVGEYGRVQ